MKDDMHIVLYAEPLFHIGPIPITNSFFMMIVVMSLILIVGRIAASRITENPNSAGRFGAAVEFLVGFLLNLVESTAGKKLGRKIFPLVSGLFIFILFANFSMYSSLFINTSEPKLQVPQLRVAISGFSSTG